MIKFILKYLKVVLGFFVPYNFVMLRKNLKNKLFERKKEKLIEKVKQELESQNSKKNFDYYKAIEYLQSIGCEKDQIELGSIPIDSLNFCANYITAINKFPLRGLHIGNFVGISLAYFINLVVSIDRNSITVSIDPNLSHRGIDNPLDKVVKLLNYFGLQKNSIILTGYSLEKSISNDGNFYVENYDPYNKFSLEASCENQLKNLGRITEQIFDFVVIDGNHEINYLEREIDEVNKLLIVGGILIIDDISSEWKTIEKVFNKSHYKNFEIIARNGRVGIMKKISNLYEI